MEDAPLMTVISIHAPRTGSDGGVPERHRAPINFNPRSPHGERRSPERPAAGRSGISIHAPRTGSDRPQPADAHGSRFQSTLPARGATGALRRGHLRVHHFNPRSPHGERPSVTLPRCCIMGFQSTLPARGATRLIDETVAICPFQSTLPARGATWEDIETVQQLVRISIHAPRTGSDAGHQNGATLRCYFNPRSPHGERRPTRNTTSPTAHFNPRSPHGERPRLTRAGSGPSHFNPRSPHGERLPPLDEVKGLLVFQSTLPARGATGGVPERHRAPLNFNPRSPHGERQSSSGRRPAERRFQSTLPARGATRALLRACPVCMISIHAPRTGSDLPSASGRPADSNFNPRSPHGERPIIIINLRRFN